jgi:nucleotide-binding universal stress UspA family protein
MTVPHTLVFGDDGSREADVAWLFVNSHVWHGWRLEVVTAKLPEFGKPPPPELAEIHAWDPPSPRTPFGEAGFASVAQLTAFADPRLVLSRECDLLVIGPRGPGMLKSLHLGSTADWLLLHPPAPLLIARHGHRVRRLTLCADGSAHADRVAEALAALPWTRDSEITVVVVDDGRTDVDRATSSARDRLERGRKPVNVCIYSGKPTEAITRHLDDASPDLIALGTRGLTGFRRLRLGSTAGAITRTARCNVLVASLDEQGAPQ